MKKIKYVFILLGVSLILVMPHVKIADSGFDASYGGGGSYGGGSSHSYSGGSSWSSHDHSSSYHSSSYSGSGEMTIDDLIMMIVILTVLIIYLISSARDANRLYKNNERVKTRSNTYNKVLEELKKAYPNITEDYIIGEAYGLYKEYIKYRNDKDLDNLMKITDVNFYEKIKTSLERNRELNSFSIVDNIELREGFIKFLDYHEGVMTAMVILNVKELQYFVDDDYNYLRGSQTKLECNAHQITIKKTLGNNNTIITNKSLCIDSAYILPDDEARNMYNTNVNIKDLLKIDSDLTEENVVNKAYQLYESLQYAWSEFNYERMRTLVSDEIYNNYRVQLKTLSSKEQKNVMSDIKLVRGAIRGFNISDNTIDISVELDVTQNDYIIGKNENILRGDKYPDHNTYEIVISKALNYKKGNCPNCGTELSKAASQTCPSCGANLITLSGEFIITKKRIIKQR